MIGSKTVDLVKPVIHNFNFFIYYIQIAVPFFFQAVTFGTHTAPAVAPVESDFTVRAQSAVLTVTLLSARCFSCAAAHMEMGLTTAVSQSKHLRAKQGQGRLPVGSKRKL